jgi:hypothetical protein
MLFESGEGSQFISEQKLSPTALITRISKQMTKLAIGRTSDA